MAGQVEFMQAIQELERYAQSNGNELSMEEIQHYFKEMNLDQTQYDFICKYFEGKQITIKNRIEKQETIEEEEIETKIDPLDGEMVSLYKEEAGKEGKISQDELVELLQKMTGGDQDARNSLIEAHLSYAMEIAGEYKGKGMQLSDLIQESNLGLMMALVDYDLENPSDFYDYVEGKIRAQIEESLGQYNMSTRSAMKMANRVNEMNEIATAYAKEHDKEASPEEIAKRMGITEEEVRDLMKISLDAVSMINESKMGNEE